MATDNSNFIVNLADFTSVLANIKIAERHAKAETFAAIVAVLMRDSGFRNIRLAEFEWLVLPPIMSGQWQIAQSAARAPTCRSAAKPQTALVVPVAKALWATV
jgi:hypothetical protein